MLTPGGRGLTPAVGFQEQRRLAGGVSKRAFVGHKAGGHSAAKPASRAVRIVVASASVSTRGGDRMMFGPETRTIAPAW